VDAGTALSESPWAGRGWTLAERYLASRILIFGDGQIFFNCRTHLLSEASQLSQNPLWQFPDSSNLIDQAGDNPSVDRSAWYTLIQYYTLASTLTSRFDVLPAVASLAAALTGGDRYFAGIWNNDRCVSLLWRSRGRYTCSNEYAAPTWSWGSMKGPVAFSVSGNKHHPRNEDVEFVEIEVKVVLGQDACTVSSQETLKGGDIDKQYGWVKAGHIRLTALACAIHGGLEPGGCRCHFDYDDEENWKNSAVEVVVALFSQWETFASGNLRWHGLLLQRVPESGADTYKRVGVYVGPMKKLPRPGAATRHPAGNIRLGDEWMYRLNKGLQLSRPRL